LLCLIAARFINPLRIEDTVSRLAGDEFVVLLPRISNRIDGELVAEKIIQELAMPITIRNTVIKVTASVGMVIFSEKLTTPQRVIKVADDAMYSAKKPAIIVTTIPILFQNSPWSK